MDRPTASPFRLGEWSVDPIAHRLARDGEMVRLEPRMMRLLVCLADHPGGVVSADDLLDQAWPGVIVTPDSVYQGVAALRRVLGDDPKQPRYIVTVPRQGYRLIALVTPMAPPVTDVPDVAPTDVAAASPTPWAPRSMATSRSHWLALAALVVVLLALAMVLRNRQADDAPYAQERVAPTSEKSVGVLPFLDLTESMGEEVFADGMTEELIDKFAKIPGLRVPAPTASFWFKDKQMTVAEIAHKLDVAYIVDGSVRKSGTTMRVAARLVRARDGFVVWSETYDRSIDDRLMIQDDIAGEVRKSIADEIGGPDAGR